MTKSNCKHFFSSSHAAESSLKQSRLEKRKAFMGGNTEGESNMIENILAKMIRITNDRKDETQLISLIKNVKIKSPPIN